RLVAGGISPPSSADGGNEARLTCRGQAALTAACQVAIALLTPPSEAGPALASLCTALRPRLDRLATLLRPPTSGDGSAGVGSGRLHLLRLMRALAACGGPGLAIVSETGAVAEQLCLCALAYPAGLSQPEAALRRSLQRELILNRREKQSLKQDQQEQQQQQHPVAGSIEAANTEIDADCRLPAVLLAAAECNRAAQAAGSARRGYMGHVIRLANCLNACLAVAAPTAANRDNNTSTVDSDATDDEAESLADLFNQLEPELLHRWSEWCQSEVADANTRCVFTAAVEAHNDEDDEDEAEFNFSAPPSPHRAMQTAYVEFQVRQLSAPMPEQFGFQEDDFNEAYELSAGADLPQDVAQHLTDFCTPTPEDSIRAAMFDQACNSRILRYESADDDNDDAADDSAGAAEYYNDVYGDGDDANGADVADSGIPLASNGGTDVGHAEDNRWALNSISEEEPAVLKAAAAAAAIGAAYAAVNGEGVGAAFPEIDCLSASTRVLVGYLRALLTSQGFVILGFVCDFLIFKLLLPGWLACFSVSVANQM
uniref:HECT domain-containing protein n=1 Tax=Macrostomum lignano TaxID=282301 RepID=A0A1I8I0R7_9PLAT